jgi:hypothetical protein
MVNEIYDGFADLDGNFVEQFQTRFDARTFELYLYAYLSRSGYHLLRDHPNPDFIVEDLGVMCAIEATTANPREAGQPGVLAVSPRELTDEELRQKLDHELPIRFGSPLFTKVQKRYWKLDHCRGLPFVIAIEAFHEFGSLYFTSSALGNYLYGLKSFPRWTESGELFLEHVEIKEHRSGAKVIPSCFFGQPDTEHVSAVLFSNSGTFAKFNRMGYQAGYHRGNITMFRRGRSFNHDRNSATPHDFLYDLDFPPCEETWGQGLVVFHNPGALHRLPRHFFREAVVHYSEDGTLLADVPATFVPLASTTVICSPEDDRELSPNSEARTGIRSILLSVFEALNPPRQSRTTAVSQEKEWFATEDASIVGTVGQDLVDKDWLYVLLKRGPNGKLETDDMRCDIQDRDEARRQLLDAMESARGHCSV